MTPRTLAAAAVLAAALPALAHDRDGQHDRGPTPAPIAVPGPVRPPALAPPAPPIHRDDGWRPDRRDHRAGEARAWREAEARRLVAELRRLDAARDAFHARFAFAPWKLRRYDARYLERRGALERELAGLHPVAWR